MSENRSAATLDDLGKLILRLALALLILLHGIAKISGGVSFIMSVLARHGVPEALAYLVYVGEVVAPVLILFGLLTRVAALLVAADIIVAVLLARSSQLLSLNNVGGWALELEGMYLFAALAIALLGAGRYSIAGTAGRWN